MRGTAQAAEVCADAQPGGAEERAEAGGAVGEAGGGEGEEREEMKAIMVRILALLIAAFCAYAAYRAHEPKLLLGSLFFGLMAFLSIRNAGAVDGLYVWRAFAVVSFFYSLTGLLDGKYGWRRHSVALDQEPLVFWLIFAASFLFGASLLVYAQFEVKRRKDG